MSGFGRTLKQARPGHPVKALLLAILILAVGGCDPGATAATPAARTTPAATAPASSPASSPAPTSGATPARGEPPPASASDPCGGGRLCALNPAVTQSTIGSTICVGGWTATIRPPQNYTTTLKIDQMKQLHLPGTTADYEEDHRLPLELGGHPSDVHNLSPEARRAIGGQAEKKDQDENGFKALVCAHTQTLVQAQQVFIAAWLAEWPNYLGGPAAPQTPAPPAPTAASTTAPTNPPAPPGFESPSPPPRTG